LINAQGDTIAASNWNSPGSFVGQNYAFRPYFKEAMQTGQGKFYAIGVTTGVPGYFLSTRIDVGGVLGVLVVKLDLRPLEAIWRAANADVALADENGIVFLSARPEWQYRALTQLTPDVLAQLDATRAYEGWASPVPRRSWRRRQSAATHPGTAGSRGLSLCRRPTGK
jgi:two-component system C4-dicarboxylate transport sensor histidine kinase DctB